MRSDTLKFLTLNSGPTSAQGIHIFALTLPIALITSSTAKAILMDCGCVGLQGLQASYVLSIWDVIIATARDLLDACDYSN